jgi:transcriptional regulator with XRE-family HTH domain
MNALSPQLARSPRASCPFDPGKREADALVQRDSWAKLRHTKPDRSSKVSNGVNDIEFRLAQHSGMSRKTSFGIKERQLPRRFKECREKAGLTQEAVANQLHVAKGRISKKETGEESYSEYFLEAFAKAIGQPAHLLIATDDVVELLEAWAKCDQDERSHFLKQIKRSAQGTPPEEPDPPAAPMMAKSRFAKHVGRGRRGAR